MAKRIFPGIPEPNLTVASLYETVAAVKQICELLTGQRSNIPAVLRDTDYNNLLAEIGALTYPVSYQPVVTANAGAFGAASAVGSYIKIGKVITFQVAVTITTIGTATGWPIVTLPPFLPSTSFLIPGRETAVNGKMLQAPITVGATAMAILNYDNTGPMVAGTVLVLSGSYW